MKFAGGSGRETRSLGTYDLIKRSHHKQLVLVKDGLGVYPGLSF